MVKYASRRNSRKKSKRNRRSKQKSRTKKVSRKSSRKTRRISKRKLSKRKKQTGGEDFIVKVQFNQPVEKIKKSAFLDKNSSLAKTLSLIREALCNAKSDIPECEMRPLHIELVDDDKDIINKIKNYNDLSSGLIDLSLRSNWTCDGDALVLKFVVGDGKHEGHRTDFHITLYRGCQYLAFFQSTIEKVLGTELI